MKKAIDKFLMSDKVLYAMPWIFTVAAIAYQIAVHLAGISSVFILGLDIINIILTFGIAISYKAHEKNIMKTLFGAIMIERIIFIFYLVNLSTEYKELFDDSDRIFAVVSLCLFIIMFVNHLTLGYGHKSNPTKVIFNRIIAFILIITCVIWNLLMSGSIPFCTLTVIYNVAIIIEILCIETKVDAYKIIRENKQIKG